jgi:hypothetical protein
MPASAGEATSVGRQARLLPRVGKREPVSIFLKANSFYIYGQIATDPKRPGGSKDKK